MKHLLLSLLLTNSSAYAQAPVWASLLPATNGRAAYQGRLEAPGLTQRQLLARAAHFARTIPPDKPSPDSAAARRLQLVASQLNEPLVKQSVRPVFLVDSSEAGHPTVRGTAAQTFPLRGEGSDNLRLPLHYTLTLRPRAGYCEYELTNFILEEPAVQLAALGYGYNPPNHRLLEEVLTRYAYYDHNQCPILPLVLYCEAVDKVARAVLREAGVAMRP